MLATVLILTFLLTVFSQIPMAVVLGISSVLALFISKEYPLLMVIQRMFSGIDSFTLLAIPMFILAGRLLNESGATERIFNFANAIVGHIKGGLGHTNIVASIIFAGISGSAVADSAGLGRVEIEAMTKEGYEPEFSSAITIASSVIGPIIPPSIPMVIYGVMAGESIIKLFAGGLIPGLLLGLALMVAVYLYAARTPGFPCRTRAKFPEVWSSFKQAFLSLLAPLIILGGLFSGFYTPTEASVIAVVYVFGLEVFSFRKLKFQDYRRILLETIIDSGTIVLIISTASIFGWLLAVEKIPNMLVDSILAITRNPYLVLIIIDAILLFLGCFVEGLAIMIILIPVLLPLVTQLGISPIHFGVLMVLTMMIGVATPPMGMSLFVVSNITGIPVMRLGKRLIPFFIPLVISLLLVTFYPQFVMFLPNLMK
ncbi:MAG: TRAP transporter large permease [Bacillota bacterium]|jgi:tripartite ATP-independent transporter DctM subunit